MYESTVRLARPIAFPISEDVRVGFLLYARLAVSLASSSVNCLGPMASSLMLISDFYNFYNPNINW